MFTVGPACGAVARGEVYLHEEFSGESFSENWVSPDNSDLGKFVLSSGKLHLDEQDTGLKTSQDAKFYMTARNFDAEFENTGKDMVVQLSVKHEQNIDCGGGYVKVYAPDTDLTSLNNESPYNIMFGPDICGAGKKIVHVILGKKGDNHLINKQIACESDAFTHAYTLILRPDNTYSVLIDNKEKASGSIEDDWGILGPKEINDPSKSKPSDWVEMKKIVDPEDVKPADYDDIPEEIEDAEATIPDDWDEEMDGEWEVPMMPNPEYRGEWTPRMIDNPDYEGPWVHPKIANPDYAPDDTLYKFTSGGVGIDLWQVKSGSIFDDILVTDDVDYAKKVAQKAIDTQASEREQQAALDTAVKEEADAARAEMDENDEMFEEFDDDELDLHDEL